MFSSPFLGTFFQFFTVTDSNGDTVKRVFVPFLGDFLSINQADLWAILREVFVPFLGDFLSIKDSETESKVYNVFSSPFLGTFFQFFHVFHDIRPLAFVFVPFLGDFLSIGSL